MPTNDGYEKIPDKSHRQKYIKIDDGLKKVLKIAWYTVHSLCTYYA